MTEQSVEHATFTIERRFAASCETVFAAWADPEAKRRWFAEADGWQDIEHDLDFRVGGRETAGGRQPGGARFDNESVFMDIAAGRRIVFAYVMKVDGSPISTSLATVELIREGTGTLLRFTEQVAFFAGSDGVDSRRGGWDWLLGQLAGELKEPAEAG